MNGLKNISKLRYNCAFAILLVALSCTTKKKTEPEPLRTEVNRIVKRGETLEIVVNDLLPRQFAIAVIDALKKAGFPFNRCIPGDSVTVVQRDNEFSKLMYYRDQKTRYYVINHGQYLVVAMKYPYIDTVTDVVQGKINSTLYESLLDMGETPNLVFRFADIFAWEIDFVTETQQNDSFYILVKKTYCDSVFYEYDSIHAARYTGEVGDYVAVYYCDPDGYDDYYNLKGESLRKSLLKSPLRFSYISSYYSKRRFHPIMKTWRPHHGLDYAAPRGTPVASVGDGVVTYRGWKGGYGNLVEVRHKNGFKTRYGHLSRFARGVHSGGRVNMGKLIGYVGSTGLSTGPHLHFEMLRDGVPINPLKVKIPRAPSVKKKYMNDYERHRDAVLKSMDRFTKPAVEVSQK